MRTSFYVVVVSVALGRTCKTNNASNNSIKKIKKNEYKLFGYYIINMITVEMGRYSLLLNSTKEYFPSSLLCYISRV